MIKVLFVCHGNICRSPMAEFYMKDLVQKEGIAEQFSIASAATSTEEIGNGVHPGTKRKLREHGIYCEGKYARQITRADYKEYDYIIGMDTWNMRNMHDTFRGDPEHKCCKLLDFTKRGGDVADPWYTGNFESTWRDVEEGCRALLQHLRNTGEIR